MTADRSECSSYSDGGRKNGKFHHVDFVCVKNGCIDFMRIEVATKSHKSQYVESMSG